MSDLGTAYVHIVPSAQGIAGSISKAIGGEAEQAGESSGKSFAEKFGSIAKKAIAAIGIGKLIGDALNQGGQLQQSLGGVETLFKGSADIVKQYASESFRTTGLSANEYMQNVTSFSASLLQSLGGDTGKAAEIANTAMIDMSDNANKMGTDMESITMAYQGFAKQQYQLLDNLKLGYGGTKTEMQRLLKDAQAITGVEYNIDNLSDVYEAIHVIQGELGITGTTAQEASTTLEGSFNSMKAAFSDLLGQMALGGDISVALQNLTSTVSTYLFGNLLPMVTQILANVPQMVVGVITGIAQYADEIINSGITLISELLIGILQAIPQVITAIGNLAQSIWNTITSTDWVGVGTEIMSSFDTGIFDQIPAIIETIGSLLSQLVAQVMQNLPQFLQQGGEIILQMVNGITSRLPSILGAIGSLLGQLVRTIISNLPQFLSQGIAIVGRIAAGLIQAIPQVLSGIGSLISQAASKFRGFNWVSLGTNIISGIVSGIWGMASAIGNALMNIARSAWNSIKSFFGIASPSKLMRDTIGKYIPMGMAEGIEGNADYVQDAMADLASSAVTMPITGTLLADPVGEMARGSTTTNMGGVTINVNASDYPDPMALAEFIEQYLTNSVRRNEEVYA